MTEPPITSRAGAASPSATGPAGPLFEGEVGAHYLLTMLADVDPRGLPGVRISRVETQRAGEGHPLDDVIVHGTNFAGQTAVLEVQVKRTITFEPADPVFKAVVEQLARALPTLDRSHEGHQFAVAAARIPTRSEGAYRDVLRWAREIGDASTFVNRVDRPKVGNETMRRFVRTLRNHLEDSGAPHDDETLWHLLRRFQILAFDFDAIGSQARELALERTRGLLDPSDVTQAGALWSNLIALSLRIAANGGDRDSTRLRSDLAEAGFRVRGSRRNQVARAALAGAAHDAVADLRRSLGGVTLSRTPLLDKLRAAPDQGRYVEIRGEPGVGKSGLLGTLAAEVLTEGRAIVLTPERTVPGGWLGLRSALATEDGARAFLADLASDGGATLFVDGLDSFTDPARQATVADLVRAAAGVPGLRVIVTARSDFDRDDGNWLPADAIGALGRAPPIIVEDLDEQEVEELRAAVPALRSVLADDHPARPVTRNLFRLGQFLHLPSSDELPRSEVDLLERWWRTADAGGDGRRERQRLLADLADAALKGQNWLRTHATTAAIDPLIARGSLRDLGADRFAFSHDVLRDWAVAMLLYLDPARVEHLPLERPAPASLARGVELAARLSLERDADGGAWVDCLARVSSAKAHSSWRRWSLLAVLRSEVAPTLLDQVAPLLLERDGTLLRELIRTALAVESRPLDEFLAEAGVTVPDGAARFFVPSNASWPRLAVWLLARRADLPPQCLIDVVDLFQSLSASMGLQDPLTPLMAEALGDWLEQIEAGGDRRPGAASPTGVAVLDHDERGRLTSALRVAFLFMTPRAPERAKRYLQSLMERSSLLDRRFGLVMSSSRTLAQAAPAELTDLVLAALIPTEPKREDSCRLEPFSHTDHAFFPPSPAQGPFLALLEAAPEHGLRLIRCLVSHAVATYSKGSDPGQDGFTVPLPEGSRFFPWRRTYGWSRHAEGSWSVESGLLALEAWSHARIERGDSPDAVIADILGPPGSPAAFLLVAVDVLISQWPRTASAALPLLGSPDLLAFDRMRPTQETLLSPNLDPLGISSPQEPVGRVKRADLQKRPSRRLSLESLIDAVAHSEKDLLDALHDLLTAAASRLGPPEPGDDFFTPRFMARHALNRLNPVNWQAMDGGWIYIEPPDEARHLEDLRREREPTWQDWPTEIGIRNALEQPGKSGSDLAAQAVAFVQRLNTVDLTADDLSAFRNSSVRRSCW